MKINNISTEDYEEMFDYATNFELKKVADYVTKIRENVAFSNIDVYNFIAYECPTLFYLMTLKDGFFDMLADYLNSETCYECTYIGDRVIKVE